MLEHKKFVRGHYERLYVNQFENVDEMIRIQGKWNLGEKTQKHKL